ncbi:hypothetical protein E2C01_085912 [Portunus trituberculatus]|uniref:Uncharacterized protein n=1 Tax=Portunus trituberculatus TaxID=210409 RepID=A0A5B7JD78_PORTR|nr:hypothetical protein [Portunus trituberculatus]
MDMGLTLVGSLAQGQLVCPPPSMAVSSSPPSMCQCQPAWSKAHHLPRLLSWPLLSLVSTPAGGKASMSHCLPPSPPCRPDHSVEEVVVETVCAAVTGDWSTTR